jgi:adenylate cyclase
MQIGFETIREILEHRSASRGYRTPAATALTKRARRELFFRITETPAPHHRAGRHRQPRQSDSLSLDVLFPRLMEVVTEALNADRSSLFLYDADAGELFSRVMQGDAIGEIRFPSHVGVAGSVFTRGEAEIIADAYADPRFNQDVDRHTGYRTRNILCVPIRNKKREVIGVTQVLNKNTGDFDLDDQHLLEGLSLQASAALENARLFEKVERQQREEAMLMEISISFVSEIHLDPLLTKIMAAATELLSADRGTLFLYDATTDELHSRVAGGIAANAIRFPATDGIAGECFTSGEGNQHRRRL